jgi:hypothetical protein
MDTIDQLSSTKPNATLHAYILTTASPHTHHHDVATAQLQGRVREGDQLSN